MRVYPRWALRVQTCSRRAHFDATLNQRATEGDVEIMNRQCIFPRHHFALLLAAVGLSMVFASTSAGMSANAQETAESQNFGALLAQAALESVRRDLQYNGSYVGLDYPWGDVPATQGVCSDVLVRAYRRLGVDLQKRLHEDMRDDFAAYPSQRVWGLSRPDRNIDHRRVLNLEVFFTRQGAALPASRNPADYQPGDLVSWMVPKYGGGTTPHIGIVSAQKAADGTPLVIHHLSGTPRHENVLFLWPVKRHFRYHIPAQSRDRA
ncbi:DUF1287 domain-containing protein [Parvularcula sp. IMCC14364]|uniref:DUF1287 domain-containing protein n=1 Tax=Parvularcula sp. IMCC14364 TaxID=3067902 RepID=UPI002740CFAB|nr:DUF1287 domain-containing protein [Parvularcula sp. IMCC14364]